MNPVVIEVSGSGHAYSVKLREAPLPTRAMTPREREATPLSLNIAEAPYSLWGALRGRGIVRRCGQHLGARIARNHGVRDALRYIATARPGEQCPIYVEVDAPELENLPWEAIWRQRLEFLALNHSASVARIASYKDNRISCERDVESKLRILAVLSARGVDPTGEWLKLRSSLDVNERCIKVHVVVDDGDVEAAIKALGDPRVTAERVPSSPTSLLQKIRDFRPNILHFFCRGTSKGARLELATRAGDVVDLDAADLSQLATISSLWFLTLNCCKAGESANAIYSQARALIDAGVPAVIGMRETIDWTDANVFTGAFYGALIPRLLTLLPPEPTADVFSESVLLDAVRAARREIHLAPRADHPKVPRVLDDSPEWTLPVLYLRRPFIKLVPRAEQSDATDSVAIRNRQKLSYLKSYIALADASEGGDARVAYDAVLRQIEGLEAVLRPPRSRTSAVG